MCECESNAGFVFPFLSVAIAAAYAGAEGSVRSLSKLEISFVVLSIVGNFVLGLFRTAHRFVFDPKLYNEWIQTYTFSSAEDFNAVSQRAHGEDISGVVHTPRGIS